MSRGIEKFDSARQSDAHRPARQSNSHRPARTARQSGSYRSTRTARQSHSNIMAIQSDKQTGKTVTQTQMTCTQADRDRQVARSIQISRKEEQFKLPADYTVIEVLINAVFVIMGMLRTTNLSNNYRLYQSGGQEVQEQGIAGLL